MKMRLTSTVLTVSLLASAPAVAQQGQESLAGAASQPLRDLSIVKQKTPDVLQSAAKGPYDNVDPKNCEAMRKEINELNDVLGDDLDKVNVDGKDDSLVTDAVKSAVRLPFAGVVRRMTGAQKREKEHQKAVVAGVARRAYLKGAISACAAPEPAAPPPLILRTEKRPDVAPPPIIPRPAPREPAVVQTADAAPKSAGAQPGTLEFQAQEALRNAPPNAIQRRTVTVGTP